MRSELIVAEKEFRDHISSKRFLLILALFLLVATYAVATGMDGYNKSLEYYKSNTASDSPYYKESISSLNKQISDARANGASAEEVRALQGQLDQYTSPKMPSVLNVFQVFVFLFAILGMVLSVSMGFDQITKEKESGSLKTVLSGPLYRDALINGKAIGSIAVLALAVAVTFLISIAIMLFYGIVPGLDDLSRLLSFFVMSLLYCTAFFAIAMAVSTFARSSGMAVVFVIGVLFLLMIFSIASGMASYAISEAIMGPAPDMPYTPVPTLSPTVNSTDQMPVAIPVPVDTAYNEYSNKKMRLQMQINDLFGTVSPFSDFVGTGGLDFPGIGGALLNKETQVQVQHTTTGYPVYYSKEVSLLDSLLSVWMKILALAVEAIVAFAVSYLVFLRMDIR